jgi:hypothetical protein
MVNEATYKITMLLTVVTETNALALPTTDICAFAKIMKASCASFIGIGLGNAPFQSENNSATKPASVNLVLEDASHTLPARLASMLG